jgi:hypothetical protein
MDWERGGGRFDQGRDKGFDKGSWEALSGFCNQIVIGVANDFDLSKLA